MSDPARPPVPRAPGRGRDGGLAADAHGAGLAASSRARFVATEIGGVRWSPAVPDRLAVVSTEGGLRSAWAWDLATGERRRVSDPSAGAEEALVTPHGTDVVWWHDPAGDERGRWMVTAFAGGEARPLLPGIPDAWAAGLSMVPGVAAAGFATDDAYVVVVATADAAPVELARQAEPLGVGREWPQGPGGLSADGRLLCLRDAAATDIAHPELRIVDVAEGTTVATLLDVGRVVDPVAWSPIPGDGRLLVIRETADRRRPWLWDLPAGTLSEVPLDLPGDVTDGWWYPDGASLLLLHEDRARPSLHRCDLATGRRATLVDRGGTIDDAGVRPDGRAWYRYDDGATPPAWLEADEAASGTPRVAAPGAPAPAGRRWEHVPCVNPAGDTIDAWLLRPDGPPPYPTILHAHGGPEWRLTDAWDPLALAYADAGYAVIAPNYRGSTGYGAAFRERLRGDPGFPETEDLLACLDRLVADGVADPGRVVLEGWSWGGYLATLGAGLHPDRWRAVVAGIPVGDLVAAHYESAPPLQAWDLAIFGGDPLEVPALYHERNPMTYVDRVAAPVLLIAGERDSRCPLGQVMVYAHALRHRGHPVEVHTYPEGHHALRAEERIAQAELILGFLARCLADP